MKKLLLITGSFAAFILVLATAIWLYGKPLLNKAAQHKAKHLSRLMGREIIFKNLDISIKNGIVLNEICISQKPDFSQGKFICASKASFIPNYTSLKSSKKSLSSAKLTGLEVNLEESNGTWNFEDIISLIGESTEPLEESWRLDLLSLKGASINVNSESKNFSGLLHNFNLDIKHKGKHFEIIGSADIKTDIQDFLAIIPVSFKYMALVDNSEISMLQGDLDLNKASWQHIELENLSLHTDFSNAKEDKKNCNISFAADNLNIGEKDKLIYANIPKYLKLFASALGKPAPQIKDAEIYKATWHLHMSNDKLTLQNLSLRSNFMEYDGSFILDTAKNKSAGTANISIGKNQIKLLSSGPIGSPNISPILSENLSSRLKEAHKNFELLLLKQFSLKQEAKKIKQLENNYGK